MATIEIHANRNLRPRVLSDGSRRGIENYFAFGHASKPTWWDDENPPVAGQIVGVYENCKGSAKDALIISEECLTVLQAHEAKSFKFEEVERLTLPEKDPISTSLCVHLRSGALFEVPVYEPIGAVFDFYRFLLSAVSERQRVQTEA